MEDWKEFLGKKVRVIINDTPSPIPKHKDGIVLKFTSTHLILKQLGTDEPVALLLSEIRRMEIKEDWKNGKYKQT